MQRVETVGAYGGRQIRGRVVRVAIRATSSPHSASEKLAHQLCRPPPPTPPAPARRRGPPPSLTPSRPGGRQRAGLRAGWGGTSGSPPPATPSAAFGTRHSQGRLVHPIIAKSCSQYPAVLGHRTRAA